MAKKAANKSRTATAPTVEQPPLEGIVIPAGAKRPQDHQEKASEKPSHRTVLVRGVEFRVEEEVLDDFELLDDINALEQKDDVSRLPSLLRRLLGDQWRQAMDACRNPDTGRVTVEAGTEFTFELLGALNPNSSSS